MVVDLSTEGKNKRGMPNVPTQSFDRRDRENEGYELEVVANLTRNWRLSGNAAWADASQTNAYVDTKAFLAQWGETMRQIVLDSGGIFNAVTGRPEPDRTIPADQRPDASVATASYNTVFFNFVPNFVDGPQKIQALTEFVANLYTDYEFRRGPLKGLRLGAGANYRGKEVINFLGADTIQDPNRPGIPLATAAIDKSAVDAYTPLYDEPYWLATATISYALKLKDRRGGRLSTQPFLASRHGARGVCPSLRPGPPPSRPLRAPRSQTPPQELSIPHPAPAQDARIPYSLHETKYIPPLPRGLS